MRYIGELVHGPESLNDCMESEVQRFAFQPPLRMQCDTINKEQYKEWWLQNASRFPRLTTLVSALLCLTPSEAAVERHFSKMKFDVTRSRTMLLPQHVVNELVVNSAIVLLDNNQQQLVVEEDCIGISTFDANKAHAHSRTQSSRTLSLFRSKEARATSRSERSEPGSELLFTPKKRKSA